MWKLKLSVVTLFVFLVVSFNAVSQPTSNEMEGKLKHIISASVLNRGPEMGYSSKNIGASLLYGYDFGRHYLANTYVTAKASYLAHEFEGDFRKHEDLIATLGVLCDVPLGVKLDWLSFQFGIDFGVLNRNSDETKFHASFYSGFLFNVYGNVYLGVDLKVQNNEIDKSYTGGGLSLSYKF